ncbi:3-phosphoshikimate 1-carboxyvinyltransferase [Propionibacterium cyclohexanicum]
MSMPSDAITRPAEPWPAPSPGHPLRTSVVVPGSKSESNRALVLAALSQDVSSIRGILHARDTELMMAALTALGTRFEAADDDIVIVHPGPLHAAGQPIDCGLAGTVMRFIPPVAALAGGRTSFVGDPRASERPLGPLLDGLHQLGVTSSAEAIPFVLEAPAQLGGRKVTIDSSASSQFVSGLLLAAPLFPQGLDLRHEGELIPSSPHIAMTVSMLERHGVQIRADRLGRHWIVEPGPIAAVDEQIEPDLTNGAAFLVAGLLTGGAVRIAGWPRRTEQPGRLIGSMAALMGATLTDTPQGFTMTGTRLLGATLDLHDASELTPVAAAMAVAARGTTAIGGVAHIRGHETDRIRAIATELSRIGVPVRENPDGLVIRGMADHLGDLHPSEGNGVFACYGDHRMVHLGALLGLLVPGMKLDDVACAAKTMPDFAQRWTAMMQGR